ncbi:preprotein translocase subunit Sec61beta [Nanoarchaeota archaeon]
MARKDNKVSMPMSTAGLTRYFEDYTTKIAFQPGHVILLVLLVIAIVVFLHVYGNTLFGIGG